MIQLRYAARSDVGLTRKSNQDSGYVGPNLAVLADGMGGPAGGDIASSIAIAHLAPLDTDSHRAEDMAELLRSSIASAHAELVERSTQDTSLQGLGTTCIAILRSSNKLQMVHIGDSRAYLLRDGVLTQVTTDHSFVQYLIDQGQLTPEEAETHPQRSVLLRVLGDADSDITLDESVREALPGDRWLLCSDGLSGVVSAQTIGELLVQTPDLEECADQLISLALRAGGPDNITCVLFDVVDPGNDPLPSQNVPTVVGAAATDRLARTRGSDSASGRAAALVGTSAGTPLKDDGENTGLTPKKHRLSVWGIIFTVLGILSLIGALVLVGYSITQKSYFVRISLSDGKPQAVLYRGLPQNIGPVSLYSKVVPSRPDAPAVAVDLDRCISNPVIFTMANGSVLYPTQDQAQVFLRSLEKICGIPNNPDQTPQDPKTPKPTPSSTSSAQGVNSANSTPATQN